MLNSFLPSSYMLNNKHLAESKLTEELTFLKVEFMAEQLYSIKSDSILVFILFSMQLFL